MSFQCSDKLGLSLELGSFAAGVMISTTDLGQHTLEQVRYFCSFLYLTSCEVPDLSFLFFLHVLSLPRMLQFLVYVSHKTLPIIVILMH